MLNGAIIVCGLARFHAFARPRTTIRDPAFALAQENFDDRSIETWAAGSAPS